MSSNATHALNEHHDDDKSINDTSLRPDLAVISEWIAPGSRVLDLGCGDGTFLAHMQNHHQVTGYGVEIEPELIPVCIDRGINVLQLNIDAGLNQFDANSFDTVTLTMSLQQLKRPDQVIADILRIGREGIVTFPNFGHWRSRLAILRGKMPRTKALPSTWYNTKNVHLCTINDFEILCRQNGIKIMDRAVINGSHDTGSAVAKFLPNLLGEFAVYRFRRE